MKKNKILNFILMFLPLIITIIALFFLPDQIPAHYGFDNQVDRWGSKFESLILPCVTIVMGWFMIMVEKLLAKERNNEKVMTIITTILLLVFNAMTYFFLYTSFNKIENLSMLAIGIVPFMHFFGVSFNC